MRKHIVGIALFATISTAEAVEVTDTQITAALAEWIIAHCGPEGAPASTATWLQVIVNGSEPGEMEKAREQIRSRIASKYTGLEAACAELGEMTQGGE